MLQVFIKEGLVGMNEEDEAVVRVTGNKKIKVHSRTF